MLTVGSVIKTTWKGFTDHFVDWLKLVLPVIVVDFVFSFGTFLLSGRSWGLTVTLTFVYMLVSAVFYLWIQIASIENADKLLSGSKLDIEGSRKRALGKFWGFAHVSILYFLVIGAAVLAGTIIGFILESLVSALAVPSGIGQSFRVLGMIAASVAAIYFGLRFGLSQVLYALDGTKGVAALRASSELVRGRMLRLLLLLMVPGLVFGIGASIVSGIVSWLEVAVAGPATGPMTPALIISSALGAAIATVISALLIPIAAIISVQIFRDFKSNRS